MPIVALDNQAVHGIDLQQVAALVGIQYDTKPKLGPSALKIRLIELLGWLDETIDAIPPHLHERKIPCRNRTIWNLVDHICELSRSYFHVSGGKGPFDTAAADAEVEGKSTLEEAHQSLERLRGRYREEECDYERDVETYFGQASLHYILERCTWHTAQHLRQLHSLLDQDEACSVEPIDKALFFDLPMPNEIWD